MRNADGSSSDQQSSASPACEQELRLQLLARLENLHDSALLDKVMVLVEMPRPVRPASSNAPLQRALTVVEWADSPLGCGLQCLRAAMEQLAAPSLEESPPCPDPNSIPLDPADAALREAETRLKELIKANAPREEIARQRADVAAIRRAQYEGPSCRPGQVLAGRYELLEVLGAGGFGAVWRAYDEQRRGNVAVKVLHARFRADESMKRRFRLGARIMHELAIEHKHIVQVLESPQQVEDCDFFVMEHLAHGNLEAAVVGQQYCNEELYPAIAQIGAALHFAHTRGVVHRDVNPSNILLHEDGSFRLADFDIARAPLTSIGSAAQIGRPEYMAPEVLYGGAKGDARSDLYSLAKTAQFLIWGQELPLAGKKDAAAFSISLPCPAAVQRVLQKALADDPAERHESVAQFVDEFQAALESDGDIGAAADASAAKDDTVVFDAPAPETSSSAPPSPTAVVAPPRAASGSPPGEEAAAAPFAIHRRLVWWPDEPPLENPDYEVVSHVGQGGMGTVVRARQCALNRDVVLKVLKQDARRSGRQQAAGQQRFVAEAVIASALDHPYITPIYDFGMDQQGRLFYAMKTVRGRAWSSVIGQRPERENLEVVLRLCDALAYAHAQGVVHRDLKPGNVMLGDFGELYVLDWGLAAASAAFQDSTLLTMSESVGGTPAYMAPEMVSGPAYRIGPATDIYLLGAVLYEILTGQPPHCGDKVMEVLFAAGKNEIAPTPRKDALVEIALKAMATQPEDRYRSARDFQRALRDCLERGHVAQSDLPAAPLPEPKTLAGAQSPSQPPIPAIPRERVVRAAGVVAAVVAVLSVVAVLAWAMSSAL